MTGKAVDSKKYYFSLVNMFLFSGSLAIISNHLGLYWVAIEATTLSLVPLIIYYRDPASIEAMWKYLFLVSVGIAFAFIGILFIALAAKNTELAQQNLFLNGLIQNGNLLNPIWLKAGFIFFFVGLSTKIGIAPMHTGDVDATSNAPSPVAALMAGALRAVALMGVLRIFQIMLPTPTADFARLILIIGGTLSVIVAFAFILRTTNFKRMIAYSSVEHLGLIALGFGIGGIALIGAVFHVFYNALTKMAIFFNAGSIHWAYKTTDITGIKGALKQIPWTGWLFLLSFFAVTAAPPFGTFFSEIMIFRGLIHEQHYLLLIFLLGLLLFIFIGMGKRTFDMLYKESSGEKVETEGFHIVHFSSVIILLTLIVTGFYMPDDIYALIMTIANDFGARP
jgi:hydrogenase-4 component F